MPLRLSMGRNQRVSKVREGGKLCYPVLASCNCNPWPCLVHPFIRDARLPILFGNCSWHQAQHHDYFTGILNTDPHSSIVVPSPWEFPSLIHSAPLTLMLVREGFNGHLEDRFGSLFPVLLSSEVWWVSTSPRTYLREAHCTHTHTPPPISLHTLQRHAF